MGTAVAIALAIVGYAFIAGIVGACSQPSMDEYSILAGAGWPLIGPLLAGSAVGKRIYEWWTRPDRVKEALKNGH